MHEKRRQRPANGKALERHLFKGAAAFSEPQFSADVLELAAEEAGVRVLDLLSDAFTKETDSYLDLMRFNLRQLQEGLSGG